MALKILLEEELNAAVKRMMIELLDDSINRLDNVAIRFDDSIHETRKNFKKLRAVIRLVRFEVGYDLYKKENILFRDTSRLLSGIRDAAVMAESVDYLRKKYSNEIGKEDFKPIRKNLSLRARKVRTQFKKNKELIAAIRNILDKHIDEIRSLPIHKRSFKLVAPGLKLVYQRGLNARVKVQQNPSASNYHEWRKRAKYLWYHIRILEDAWPEYMVLLAGKLSDLSDILGREHDLAELRDLIVRDRELLEDESSRNRFLNYLGQERLTLQSEAKTTAPFIYSESANQFVSRIESYWNQSAKNS